jgi:hypothetical protein
MSWKTSCFLAVVRFAKGWFFERRHGCELYQKLPNSLFIAPCSVGFAWSSWSLEWLDAWLATQVVCRIAHSLEEVTELTTSCMTRLLFCTWPAVAHEDEWFHLKQKSPRFAVSRRIPASLHILFTTIAARPGCVIRSFADNQGGPFSLGRRESFQASLILQHEEKGCPYLGASA